MGERTDMCFRSVGSVNDFVDQGASADNSASFVEIHGNLVQASQVNNDIRLSEIPRNCPPMSARLSEELDAIFYCPLNLNK